MFQLFLGAADYSKEEKRHIICPHSVVTHTQTHTLPYQLAPPSEQDPCLSL